MRKRRFFSHTSFPQRAPWSPAGWWLKSPFLACRLQWCFCGGGHASESVALSQHQWPEADDELFQAGLCQETNGGIAARHQELPLTVSSAYKHRLGELAQHRITSHIFVHRRGGSVIRYSKSWFNLALIFHPLGVNIAPCLSGNCRLWMLFVHPMWLWVKKVFPLPQKIGGSLSEELSLPVSKVCAFASLLIA